MAMYVFAVKRLSEKFVTVCREKLPIYLSQQLVFMTKKVEKKRP